MSTTDQFPKPKLHWYQFSLKTLLLVMLMSCVAFAWIGWRMQQARENRARVATSEKEIEQAVAEIEKLGAVVTSSHVELRPQTWLEEQFDDPGGVDDPVRILEVTGVRLVGPSALPDPELYRREGKVTDAGLAHLNKLKALETLDLYRSNITDAGLEHVRGLKRLKFLMLQSTYITDAGLMHLV